MPIPDEPITRRELFLAAIAGEAVTLPEPVTREEMYYAAIAAGQRDGGPEPTTREEMYFRRITDEGIAPQSDVPVYGGPYTVTPSGSDTALKTKNKRMSDNVTVLKIPLYETSNTGGGYTAVIGG